MKELNLNRRIKHSIYISILLLLLSFGNYYWQQISEYAPPIVLTWTLALNILVLFKIGSTGITIWRNRKKIKFKILLPTAIYASTLLTIFINPHFLHAESFQPEILYRGCYEGTMNSGTIFFRVNGKFEYRHVGFFGITTFKKGTWTHTGDTLNITYKDEPSEFVGTSLLLTDEEFIRIEGDSLSIKKSRFYRGYCKMLN